MSRRRLTAREWQVLRGISLGQTSGEIAAALGVTEHTVNDYRKSVHLKFGVRRSHHAVAVAIQDGVLP